MKVWPATDRDCCDGKDADAGVLPEFESNDERGGVHSRTFTQNPSAAPVTRRACLAFLGLALSRHARGADSEGTAFDARGLRFRNDDDQVDPSVLASIAHELDRRTSAGVVKAPSIVNAGAGGVLASPFLLTAGRGAIDPLDDAARTRLRAFFALGGLLVIDDRDGGLAPVGGPFSRSVLRELAPVLPDSAPLDLGEDHVLFRSFYLLKRIAGAKGSSSTLRALARGNRIEAIVVRHDLSSALATKGNRWLYALDEGERELAIRFAVNVAMYSLCSTYKDDQVHAPFLMRRRAGAVRSR